MPVLLSCHSFPCSPCFGYTSLLFSLPQCFRTCYSFFLNELILFFCFLIDLFKIFLFYIVVDLQCCDTCSFLSDPSLELSASLSFLIQSQFSQFNLKFNLLRDNLYVLYSLYWVIGLMCNSVLICVIICAMFAYPLYHKLFQKNPVSLLTAESLVNGIISVLQEFLRKLCGINMLQVIFFRRNLIINHDLQTLN